MSTTATLPVLIDRIDAYDRAHDAWMRTEPGSEAAHQAMQETLAEAHALAVHVSIEMERRRARNHRYHARFIEQHPAEAVASAELQASLNGQDNGGE